MLPLRVSKMYTIFRTYACIKNDCKMLPLRVSKMYTVFRTYACIKNNCKMLPPSLFGIGPGIFRNHAPSKVLETMPGDSQAHLPSPVY